MATKGAATEDSPAGWADADPTSRRSAIGFSDLSLPNRSLPFHSEGTTGPMPASQLREMARRVVRSFGFHVALDYPPPLAGPVLNLSPVCRAYTGIVVGERRISVDPVRRHSALLRGVVTLASGIVLIVVAAVFGLWTGSLISILIIPGLGLAVYGLMFGLPALGSFDSEVLYLQYQPRIPVEAGREGISWSTPILFDIQIGAGRIASANWRGNRGNGRDFKAVLPGGTELATLPQQSLEGLTSHPPLSQNVQVA